MWVDPEAPAAPVAEAPADEAPRPNLFETGKEIALATLRLEVELVRAMMSFLPKPTRRPGQGW